MFAFQKVASRLFSMFVLVVLAACGGGGGGGGSSGGGAPGFTLSATSIDLSAAQNAPTPVSPVITVTATGGTVYIKSSATVSGIYGVALTCPGGPQCSVTVNPKPPSSLSPGTYTDTVTLQACADLGCLGPIGGAQTIQVTYTISAAPTVSAAPNSLEFSAAEGGAPPVVRNVSLSYSAGSSAWTSTISYSSGTPGWLSVTPSQGATLPVTLSVGASSMPAGVYTASIAFNVGGSTVSVPVTLTVNAPSVNYVSPYVATAGIGGNVIIRGYGFSGFAAPVVRFGTTTATVAPGHNDTEIRASYPALAAGSYQVSVGDGTSSLATRARLVVVAPPALPYTAISRSSATTTYPRQIVFDAERKAIYIRADEYWGVNNVLERYRFNGVSWVSDSRSINYLSNIALTPDGKELVVTDWRTFYHYDLAAASLFASFSVAAPSPKLGTSPLSSMAMANDGGVIGMAGLSNLYRYDVLTHVFSLVDPASSHIDYGYVLASGDGSLLLTSYTNACYTTTTNVGITSYSYHSSTNAVAPTPLGLKCGRPMAINRTGTVSLIYNVDNVASTNEHIVYDSVFNRLGTLQRLDGLSSTTTSQVSALSPDGTRGYAYNGSTGMVYAFDLTAPNGTGGFTEIGTGTTIDLLGSAPTMAVSPDGGTLFLAGSDRLVIMPAP